VSIGAVLADARWRARLTVSEVSRQTRIREAIIWGIEKDDYSACGGDAYARGHIRAIARVVGTDPDPLIQEYDETVRTTGDIEELVVLRPAAATARGHRGRLAWTAALGLAVLAIVGWAAFHVATGAGHARGGKALAAADSASRNAASHRAGPAPAGDGTPRPSPSPSPTRSTAAPVPPPVPAQALTPAGAVAFGPGGPGAGDDPQHADLAIDGSRRTAWETDWYTTADFGHLQSGTGLLLDMGRRVTITGAEITLGGLPGANVQLRTGNVAALAGLHEVASTAGAGGTVRMQFTARAEYVLIWFTRLPPDVSGTYQAAVYRIVLRGQR
jgi:cytoskeletal protein RodZ